MARRKQKPEPQHVDGAPEWMVTFSDCMTLLLTFFVLLLSFSSFDERIFRKLKVIFAGSLSSVSQSVKRDRDAFLPVTQFSHEEELDKGNEKPTLARGAEDNLKQETETADFRNRKVFLVPSERIFWGKGTVISRQGSKILAIMASFLKEAPNRIVISENAWWTDGNSRRSSLPRAWAVMEYLTTIQGLDQNQFSISAASTVTQEILRTDESTPSETKEKRMLEIVLLERSIYN
ncbi:MAG: hypothetical protein ISS79_00825 [Phycisphaerae bacterium]|nr:hypothetical protein [Phycisphaerae bacterium]